MKKTNKFLSAVTKHQQSQSKETFSGFLKDYLEVLELNLDASALAHKRLYDAITKHGITRMKDDNARCRKLFNGESVRTYDYFQDSFFGMELSLNKVMRFLHSAAMRGEESRQVLLLLGPVGAGKSALVEHIKKALEAAEGVYHIASCPIREEPLHLIPRALREEFEEVYGVKIEGDLCPVCRYTLLEDYDGDYTKVPIKVSSFSIRGLSLIHI